MCLTLLHFYLYAKFFLKQFSKSMKMRAFVGNNGEKLVERSNAKDTFLINDV